MSDNSTIEWTDATWNPVTGCTKVSQGCDHCYAETFAERFRGTPGHHFKAGFDLVLRPERLDQPLRWRKPRRIFVNSMSDLFHERIPDEYIARVFGVMARAPQHTFQLLTKRHGRMRSLVKGDDGSGHRLLEAAPDEETAQALYEQWPLPNVWLGVSIENQHWADIRVPALRDTPAAVRMLSCEPLLGPIVTDLTGIGWVIVGGESGHRARPMHPHWARSLRDQCVAANVPFLFKQWGEHIPAVVEDAPDFAGGRAWTHPRGGGRTSATLLERGPSGTFRGGDVRLMRPNNTNGHGVLLDCDTMAVRVGKAKAGRVLDGRTWDEYPDGDS